MIDFEYKNQTNPELFTFKVTVNGIFKEIYDKPLNVKFYSMDGDGWETQVLSGHWCQWNGGFNSRWNVQIEDDNGNILYDKKYNSIEDGSILDKAFTWFNKINKNTKGIVIGSHDGSWGHWVQSVLDGETESIIIEGSEKQYKKLLKNYGNLNNTNCLNRIITTDGKDVTWYVGGDGFTDSVKKDIKKTFFTNDNEIIEEVKSTYSINQLIIDYNYQDFDWLHTDLEGYDCELIMSLNYLPKLIIFENEHCKKINTYDDCIRFLKDNNYFIYEHGIDTMAIKKS